jgi:hypothetical protein
MWPRSFLHDDLERAVVRARVAAIIPLHCSGLSMTPRWPPGAAIWVVCLCCQGAVLPAVGGRHHRRHHRLGVHHHHDAQAHGRGGQLHRAGQATPLGGSPAREGQALGAHRKWMTLVCGVYCAVVLTPLSVAPAGDEPLPGHDGADAGRDRRVVRPATPRQGTPTTTLNAMGQTPPRILDLI